MKCSECNHLELEADCEIEQGLCWQCHHAAMRGMHRHQVVAGLASFNEEEQREILEEAYRMRREERAA